MKYQRFTKSGLLGLEYLSLWQILKSFNSSSTLAAGDRDGFNWVMNHWSNSIYKFGLSGWVFVCLYPINVITAEPIGPTFFVGSRVTPGKIYRWFSKKISLGSRDDPQKMWARSVQPFWRLLDTNKQTPRQVKFIYRRYLWFSWYRERNCEH